jgi:hypothetical protein
VILPVPWVERYRDEAHIGWRPAPSEELAQAVGRETQPNEDAQSR